MQRFRLLLIGLGFVWILLWSLFGSLLAARLRTIALQNIEGFGPDYNWQHSLLKTTHAHMNLMGITLILIGLTVPMLQSDFKDKFLKKIIFIHVISVPLFGFGLILEAFFSAPKNSFSWITGVTSLGATGYIFTIGLWASLFLFCGMKKDYG